MNPPEPQTGRDLSAALQSVFGGSPTAALLLGADGVVDWCNDAARRLLPRAGPRASLPTALEPSPQAAAALDAARVAGTPTCIDIDRGGAAVTAVELTPLHGGAALLLLHERISSPDAASAPADALRERLDAAQEYGRLGVWERDLRTLRGHWDRHLQRLWGLPDGAGTPEFDAAMAAVVDEDRARVSEAFLRSREACGHYESRYRLRGGDGKLRHVHSQWKVLPGADGRPARAVGTVLDDTETWHLAREHAATSSQLALAVQLSNLGLWRHDLRTGLIELDGMARALLGLGEGPGVLPVDALRALIHPEDLPRVLEVGRVALEAVGGTFDAEARHRLPGGGWRHVMTRRVLQRDPDGRPLAFVGVVLDIGARVADSRRGEELARRFELVTRSAGIGYWVLEGHEERANWSDELRAIHGLPDDAPVPTLHEWLEHHVHPGDRDEVAGRLREWSRGSSGNLLLEMRLVRPDGEVREVLTHQRVEIGGPAPWLFGVVIDVTERRLAERALRQANERAALAAAGTGIGTWELDLHTGRAVWDEQMWRLRGLEPRADAPDAAGRLAVVHPDDRQAVGRVVDEIVARSGPASHEFRVVWPDGTVRWLASRSTTVADDAGAPLRRIGVNWDVTDRRVAEAAQREREVAERESQAKSRFLARMSHELRTPLNAVLGFAQLLVADEDSGRGDAVERRRRLSLIEDAGRHLLSLINDVLDLTSLESGEMRVDRVAVAVRPLVDAARALVEPQAAARAVVLQATVGDDIAVTGDATRLRQVLLNLLSNAVKYNRPGGRVRLDAARRDHQVRLRVRDDGRGMTAGQLQHLFEPFNRLGIEREGIEGTGIGLVIVRSIVERMGGHIEVRSEPGVGSEFTVWLPAAAIPPSAPADRALAAAAPPEEAMPSPAGRRRRAVLYVEDNPVNALIIRELLARRPDLEVHVAADGAGGISCAVDLRPELVLLDMQLPDMDGFEVLRRLRADARTAGIPCVALSANAMPDDIRRALDAGMAGYWTKPLDLGAFMGAIDARFGPAP